MLCPRSNGLCCTLDKGLRFQFPLGLPIKASVKKRWGQCTLTVYTERRSLHVTVRTLCWSLYKWYLPIFMAAVVLFRLHCTIMMRGSSFDLKFSWALHAKTPLHVFLIGFYFKCSFEGVLLWRGNRNAANAPHLSTPLCADCGSLYPDFSLSLVFFDSLHALISTPISFWLWVILQPRLKIDMVWQWQSAMLNYWKSLWLCLLPIWTSLIVSSAILHSNIVSIVIYCRAKRYHQKKSHLPPFCINVRTFAKKKVCRSAAVTV